MLYAQFFYNFNSKNSKETVQVSGHRYETSILGEKNTEEMSQAPNDWNKYKQETQRTGKKRLLTDMSTTKELVKAFID